MLDPVNNVVAEYGGGNFLQRTFVSILKMNPAVLKMHHKPGGVRNSPPGKSLATKDCIISLTKYSLLKLR
jgi:hypothetical protein